MSVYGATKAATRYFARSIIDETRGGPVLVGVLSPGPMVTDMLKQQYRGADEKRRKLYAKIASTPEEVAAKIVPAILANTKHGASIGVGGLDIVVKLAFGKDRGLFKDV